MSIFSFLVFLFSFFFYFDQNYQSLISFTGFFKKYTFVTFFYYKII
jgi:hypothetical protein